MSPQRNCGPKKEICSVDGKGDLQYKTSGQYAKGDLRSPSIWVSFISGTHLDYSDSGRRSRSWVRTLVGEVQDLSSSVVRYWNSFRHGVFCSSSLIVFCFTDYRATCVIHILGHLDLRYTYFLASGIELRYTSLDLRCTDYRVASEILAGVIRIFWGSPEEEPVDPTLCRVSAKGLFPRLWQKNQIGGEPIVPNNKIYGSNMAVRGPYGLLKKKRVLLIESMGFKPTRQ